MNVAEATRLCRLIAACSPAQKFEAETPAVWAGVLERVRLEDATEAVRQVVASSAWVAPADIIARVRDIRRERLETADGLVPNVDPDDPVGYARELAAITRAAGDGDLDVAAYEAGGVTLTGARPLRALGERVERRPLALEGVCRGVA